MSLAFKARHLWAARKKGSAARYLLAERAAAVLHPDAVLSEMDRAWMHDREFRDAYQSLDPNNLRRLDRAWNLMQFSKTVRHLPGDTVECGAFKGLTSHFICAATQDGARTHHVFDSFEGVSAPSALDGTHWSRGDLSSAEKIARANLATFPNVAFYPGWIPGRFHEVADRWFVLIHIDVDLYEPTRDSLDFLLPRALPGAVVVLDDYGFTTCPGARAAVDETCARLSLQVAELSSGQGVILMP